MLSTQEMLEVEEMAVKLLRWFDQVQSTEGDQRGTSLLISDAADALLALIDQQATIKRKVV